MVRSTLSTRPQSVVAQIRSVNNKLASKIGHTFFPGIVTENPSLEIRDRYFSFGLVVSDLISVRYKVRRGVRMCCGAGPYGAGHGAFGGTSGVLAPPWVQITLSYGLIWVDLVVLRLLVMLSCPFVGFPASGGAKGVVERPWVRRDSGHFRVRGSSWGPQNPSLRPCMARAQRVLPIGAAFETICAVSRKWWCQTGRHGTMGPS